MEYLLKFNNSESATVLKAIQADESLRLEFVVMLGLKAMRSDRTPAGKPSNVPAVLLDRFVLHESFYIEIPVFNKIIKDCNMNMSRQELKKNMLDAGITQERKYIDGKQRRIYSGLKLKELDT